ncbi:hypothetical protein E4L95_02270 [Paracoccus liaowanqingii]|uniref:Uncharacterized protein n=1 Tax=Paracoccus liaowanqingii TaxID=2560053 RepID=A0A4Z1CSE6_9RHOB|nr:hypothetical protein E4191_19720 [Paracoccus liaowanqingii]TGN68202.1 hypothetical protein E4L95_02270 [Paracoccus liaowanqingii]
MPASIHLAAGQTAPQGCSACVAASVPYIRGKVSADPSSHLRRYATWFSVRPWCA